MAVQTFYGADISTYQGAVNWAAFNPGAAFVFIKAGGGDGKTQPLYVDDKFAANKAGARSLGAQMPHGFYWFGGSNDATDEAHYFATNCVNDLEVGEVLVLDSESGAALSPAWCLEWLQAVESLTGVKPLIYMSASKTTEHDWSAVVANGNGLWVADYGVTPTQTVPIKYWPFYAFHQYKDNGTFPGISGNVDADAAFLEALTDFYKYGKQPTTTTPPPTPAPAPVDSPTAPSPPVIVTPSPVTPTTPEPGQPPIVTTGPPVVSVPAQPSVLEHDYLLILNFFRGKKTYLTGLFMLATAAEKYITGHTTLSQFLTTVQGLTGLNGIAVIMLRAGIAKVEAKL